MKTALFAGSLSLALPLCALADDPPKAPDGQWHGTGEAGIALASGNAKSENVNGKFTLKMEDERWKYDFFLEALRNKADVTTTTTGGTADNPTTSTTTRYELTSERYDGGAAAGFKFDDKSYLVGSLRYEHDAFSPYQYQYTVSLGYGYQFLKNASDELSVEAGPAYKEIQPIQVPPGAKPDSESDLAFRGQLQYKHNFNKSTSFVNTLLVESSSSNTYAQNDAGLLVKMTDKLALKAGYQVRYNSDVLAGYKRTDELVTTNVVYGF